MNTHCDICRYQGDWREAVEEIERVAVCHDHRLDIREGKMHSMLWSQVRVALGLLRRPKEEAETEGDNLTRVSQLVLDSIQKESVEVPVRTEKSGRQRGEKTQQIIVALRMGLSTKDIVRTLGTTESMIYYVKSKYEADIEAPAARVEGGGIA